MIDFEGSEARLEIDRLQSEIDRLTEQNLQLRLIADRAVVFLLAGSKPEQSEMNDYQISKLAAYVDAVKYNDIAEADSAEAAFIDLLILPLLNIAANNPVETNLLELSMAEIKRNGLISQEIQQLDAFDQQKFAGKSELVNLVKLALNFARNAGVIADEQLNNLYSPSVALSRM